MPPWYSILPEGVPADDFLSAEPYNGGVGMDKVEGKAEGIREIVATIHQEGLCPEEIVKFTHIPLEQVLEYLNVSAMENVSEVASKGDSNGANP
jgi:hypothetical protein